MGEGVSYLNPPSATPVFGMYSHVAIAEPGRLAFIAGQVAVDAGGTIVAPGDVAGQVPVVFAHLEGIIADLGARPSDIVSLTTYLVGEGALEPWFGAREAVYRQLFADGRYPPNTLLVVSGLNRAGLRVEISAVVRLPR
jgi:enamine deaminase RidA (YjgF/YER057c/UK114 family)